MVGDITYLRTQAGWRITDYMRATSIIDAMEMARLHGYLQPNAVFHSHRGTQDEFNWSWQHLQVMEVFDGGDGGLEQEDQRCSRGCGLAMTCRSGVTPAYAFARFACSIAGGSAADLASDLASDRHRYPFS